MIRRQVVEWNVLLPTPRTPIRGAEHVSPVARPATREFTSHEAASEQRQITGPCAQVFAQILRSSAKILDIKRLTKPCPGGRGRQQTSRTDARLVFGDYPLRRFAHGGAAQNMFSARPNAGVAMSETSPPSFTSARTV